MAYTQKNNPFKKNRPDKINILKQKIQQQRALQDPNLEGASQKDLDKALNKELKYLKKLNKLESKEGLEITKYSHNYEGESNIRI